MTFSIVAHDPDTSSWGVAVASKFLASAHIVSWAAVNVGAIANQAWGRLPSGPRGLALLAQGKSAQETIDALLSDDPNPELRQFGVVDARGGVAAYSGSGISDVKAHVIGEGFCCQGNILTGSDVVHVMAESFRTAHGDLPARLLKALADGQAAGGDRRGKQSAGLLVLRPNGGWAGYSDHYVDLRVDDDPDPIPKLQAMLELHRVIRGVAGPHDLVAVDAEVFSKLSLLLNRAGYQGVVNKDTWNRDLHDRFWTLLENENIEERWDFRGNPNVIDRVSLDFLVGRLR